jgi:small subunit ribosomal protein S15
MYINPEIKRNLFTANSFGKDVKDTGSPESQVALFTFRINHLNEHLGRNKNDNSTKQGLLKLVGKRKKLLNYLMQVDIERYRAIIKKLGIRK